MLSCAKNLITTLTATLASTAEQINVNTRQLTKYINDITNDKTLAQ